MFRTQTIHPRHLKVALFLQEQMDMIFRTARIRMVARYCAPPREFGQPASADTLAAAKAHDPDLRYSGSGGGLPPVQGSVGPADRQPRVGVCQPLAIRIQQAACCMFPVCPSIRMPDNTTTA